MPLECPPYSWRFKVTQQKTCGGATHLAPALGVTRDCKRRRGVGFRLQVQRYGHASTASCGGWGHHRLLLLLLRYVFTSGKLLTNFPLSPSVGWWAWTDEISAARETVVESRRDRERRNRLVILSGRAESRGRSMGLGCLYEPRRRDDGSRSPGELISLSVPAHASRESWSSTWDRRIRCHALSIRIKTTNNYYSSVPTVARSVTGVCVYINQPSNISSTAFYCASQTAGVTYPRRPIPLLTSLLSQYVQLQYYFFKNKVSHEQKMPAHFRLIWLSSKSVLPRCGTAKLHGYFIRPNKHFKRRHFYL